MDIEGNMEDIIENRNMRNLEIFLMTTESILEATQNLLNSLKENKE